MKSKSRAICLITAVLLLTAALAACDNDGTSTSRHALASASSAPAPAAPGTVASAGSEHAHFTISGHTPGLKEGTKVTLLEMDANPDKVDPTIKLSTAKVHNGNFKMTGSVDQPRRGVLSWGAHASTSMIIENAAYEVVNTGAGLVVKGGHYNDLAYGYEWLPAYVAAKKSEEKASHQAFAHINEMDEAAMTAAQKAVAPSRKAVRQIKNDYQSRILDGNGPVLLKLLVLPDNYDWKRYDPAKRKSMYATYEKQLGENPVLQRIHYAAKLEKKNQAAQNMLAAGKPYRDIVAVNAHGKKVKLSAVLSRNKLVLVDFWASWCAPCRAEFPHLAKTYEEFHEDGFEIYAVSLDESRDDWRKALKEERGKNKIPWINLRAPGIDSTSAQAYGVQRLPSNFLISGDGTIVGKNMQDWGVEHAVRKQFGKLKHGKG